MRLLLLPLAVGAVLIALTGCMPLNGSVGTALLGTKGVATAGDNGPMGAAAYSAGSTQGNSLRDPKDTIGGGISP